MIEQAPPRTSRRAALRGVGLTLASTLYSACKGAHEAATAADAAPDGARPEPPSDAGAPPAMSDASAPTVDGARPRVPLPARPLDLVDVHAHFVPDAYRSAAEAAGYDLSRGATFGPWSLEEHLRLADGLGVSLSVLSLPPPGVHFGDAAQAVALARTMNDEAAALVARAPARLRFLAVLPLPDVTPSLTEWTRAAALPGCVGAVLCAEARGVYVGDAALDPLLSALSDAKAAVLVQGQIPAAATTPSLEAQASLTRAAMTMFEQRVVTRFPGVRFILAGAGGILPGVLDRIQTFGLAGYTISPDQTKTELAGLYFDCAGAVLSTQLPALLKHVPVTRLLYGSDSGALPFNAIAALIGALDDELPAAPGASLRSHCIETARSFDLA